MIIQDSQQSKEACQKDTRRYIYRIVSNTGTVFHYMDKDLMRKIITTMIKSMMEYDESVWSPHKKKHVNKTV